MTSEDRAEVMKMIKEAKDEIRNYIRDNSNIHSGIEANTDQNVSDNTDAILELAEIIGGGE